MKKPPDSESNDRSGELAEQRALAAATALREAKSFARRLVEVQENERRSIARELHDEAAQALASLRYGLRLLEREIEEGGSVTERVAELMQRTDAVIDSLHRLVADLRPASLDHLGLEAALREYSRSAASKFGLDVRFKARGFGSERLPQVVETALYRVVQEAMVNVARHARAARVDVLLEHRGDRVMVMIEDNGVGFEPDLVERGDHFGLLGIQERAEALGGTLTLESAPGTGTTIVVEVASADPDPDR
ncbi:MAG: sensor histidine kinase [Acidobacteriota bacterium]